MLADQSDLTKIPPQVPKPLSLVLSNALFKTTAVNGALLFGNLAEDFVKVERGRGSISRSVLHAYLPTLPDPYAADVTQLKFQFRGANDSFVSRSLPSLWLLLVSQVQWDPAIGA